MRKLKPVTPGEILLEEFLKPLEISQYRLAKEVGVPAQRAALLERQRSLLLQDLPGDETDADVVEEEAPPSADEDHDAPHHEGDRDLGVREATAARRRGPGRKDRGPVSGG